MAGLSLVLSTFNGASCLQDVLAGYAACRQPDSAWELIIVNNCSTDNTEDVILEFKDKLPLTILRHDVPGKNGCLNYALTVAVGDLIVLTDDDAIPDVNFICEWETMLFEAEEFDVFGGRVVPRFPSAIPGFLEKNREHFPALFAAIDRAHGPADKDSVFGPNMAVRMRVFKGGLLFDEAIGPNSSQHFYMMGSESEFCDRADRAGLKFWFNSKAVVAHIIRPHQMTRDFVMARAFRHGRGVAYREMLHGTPSSPVSRNLERAKLLIRSWRHRLFPSTADEALWSFHWKRGYAEAKQKLIAGDLRLQTNSHSLNPEAQ
jgi:glycosyltransferase involved in cell wall biosynthesis